MKRKIGMAFAAALIAGALVAPPPAQAQVAGATIGVKGLNRHGGDVGCSYPATTGTAIGTCPVSASASGTTIDNYCREEVAVSAPPAGVTVSRDGCSISVSGLITAIRSTVGNSSETAVYTCIGAGIGSMRYTPAPGSAGVGISGPVVMTYVNGVLTAHGPMLNLGPISIGEATATLLDPCGPDALPHLYTAQMNL